MSTKIVMPQLGNEITEAEVTEWLKAEGEAVSEGDFVALITTTKMSFELEAPASGVLGKIEVAEGELASVGAVLASVETASE